MKKKDFKERIVNNIIKKKKKVAPNNDEPIQDKALLESHAMYQILSMRMDSTLIEMHKIETVDQEKILIIASELIAISKKSKYIMLKFQIGNISDYSTLTLQFKELNKKIHYTTNLAKEYIASNSPR